MTISRSARVCLLSLIFLGCAPRGGDLPSERNPRDLAARISKLELPRYVTITSFVDTFVRESGVCEEGVLTVVIALEIATFDTLVKQAQAKGYSDPTPSSADSAFFSRHNLGPGGPYRLVMGSTKEDYEVSVLNTADRTLHVEKVQVSGTGC